MREFKTGATRDTDSGKNDYEGFLSFPVIEAYGNYMNKHRIQADGKLRDSDNWQKGFGENHWDVCIKSAWRHFLDFWAIHRGYKRFDSKDGHEITMEEAGCAILFNIMAYLHILLKQKETSRPFIEKGNELPSYIKDGKCYKEGDNYEGIICPLGYACKDCPYNKGNK